MRHLSKYDAASSRTVSAQFSTQTKMDTVQSIQNLKKYEKVKRCETLLHHMILPFAENIAPNWRDVKFQEMLQPTFVDSNEGRGPKVVKMSFSYPPILPCRFHR